MKIKITFDPDGAYGYPKDGIIDAKQLVNDYIENLNEVEDADTIAFLKRIEIEKAADFVAEMWSLDYEIVQSEHFRVNIGHYSPDCFHHFDNEQTMFRWISEKVGEEIHSFDDCEAWTRKQDDEHGSYIEILYMSDIKEFYENRRAYVQKVRECEDSMTKAQRKTLAGNRNVQMAKFSKAYDEAHWYWDMYPEVWQGEI